jgi:hypothetical protein
MVCAPGQKSVKRGGKLHVFRFEANGTCSCGRIRVGMKRVNGTDEPEQCSNTHRADANAIRRAETGLAKGARSGSITLPNAELTPGGVAS